MTTRLTTWWPRNSPVTVLAIHAFAPSASPAEIASSSSARREVMLPNAGAGARGGGPATVTPAKATGTNPANTPSRVDGAMRQRARSQRATAAAIAAGFFLASAALVWTGTMPVLSGVDVCNDFGERPEGSSSSSKPDVFPPGTITCEYRAPDGEVTTSLYVPWFEWLVLAAGSLLLWWLALGVLRAGRRRSTHEARG